MKIYLKVPDCGGVGGHRTFVPVQRPSTKMCKTKRKNERKLAMECENDEYMLYYTQKEWRKDGNQMYFPRRIMKTDA